MVTKIRRALFVPVPNNRQLTTACDTRVGDLVLAPSFYDPQTDTHAHIITKNKINSFEILYLQIVEIGLNG